jgi:hypothetical protein
MSALDQFLSSATTVVNKSVSLSDLPEVSMEEFYSELDAEVTTHTVTDQQFRFLKDFAFRVQQETMAGTYIPSDHDNRLIVTWFRAQRERAFTAVREKPVKVVKPKAPPKEKKKTKKQLAEEQAAEQAVFDTNPNNLFELLF